MNFCAIFVHLIKKRKKEGNRREQEKPFRIIRGHRREKKVAEAQKTIESNSASRLLSELKKEAEANKAREKGQQEATD